MKNRPQTGSDIRKTFLDYFAERGHRIIPSSSLIPAQDPTLLFTNAGMNQFKEVFLGKESRPYKRAVSSQKCMRVSGKHNDLEQVGRTPRHHTFFEMLGNFSFGDYFKKDAIAYAWELLTTVYGLPAGKLYPTVFREDDEAFEIWRRDIGVPKERITRLGEKDNFWSMGDTGPCGPCSEILYDRGTRHGCRRRDCTVEHDCGRYMELWNLVFIQHDRQSDGSSTPLKRTGVDTGMGLERITSVIQNVSSNYETDLFTSIVDAIRAHAKRIVGSEPDGDDDSTRIALHVIADHVRAMVFLMSDGVVPSNDGRGYVLRRIMRRAIRFARSMRIRDPFLCELSGTVIDRMGVPEVYPDLVAHRALIEGMARREEERFAETLVFGLEKVEALASGLKGSGAIVIPGVDAFKLYDTFGLPLDMIRDVADAHGITVDEAGFEKAMEKQRSRSRIGMRVTAPAPVGLIKNLPQKGTEFVGYDALRVEDARVIALLKGEVAVDALKSGEEGQVLLDRTAFYAEGGGQIGDSGFLTASSGVARVRDTQAPLPGLNLHIVTIDEGRLRVGDRVMAEVDGARRLAVMRSHDATHLVHAALRDVVGTHVKQAGSLVNPDRFRFDFSHYAPLSEEILGQVEDEVNDVIRQDLPITASIMPFDEALKRGALAFFGDKYGDMVRVVEVPGFSMELCGGTHASSTGSIGLLKLSQERGIAAGIRRIEALSGEEALVQLREDRRIVDRLQSALNVGRDRLQDTLARLLEQNRSLQREVEKLKITMAAGSGSGLVADEVRDISGIKVMVRGPHEGLDKGALRELVDRSRQRLPSGVIVQWARRDNRVTITTSVSRDLIPPLHAGQIVRDLAELINGRGGGKPEMAEAGGKDSGDLGAARDRTFEIVERFIRRAGATG